VICPVGTLFKWEHSCVTPLTFLLECSRRASGSEGGMVLREACRLCQPIVTLKISNGLDWTLLSWKPNNDHGDYHLLTTPTLPVLWIPRKDTKHYSEMGICIMPIHGHRLTGVNRSDPSHNCPVDVLLIPPNGTGMGPVLRYLYTCTYTGTVCSPSSEALITSFSIPYNSPFVLGVLQMVVRLN